MTRPAFTADALLFDSDGVLVDSHTQVRDAWSALARHLDVDADRLHADALGVPARQALSRLLAGDALDEAVAVLEELEVRGATGTGPVPGAPALTGSLPDGSFAIVTSASRRLGLARWSAAGITVPRHVVTADDVALGKPHPEPYLRAAELLGVAPWSCIVFEDSDAGAAAASAAGATVIAVGSAPWDRGCAARIPDLRSVEVTIRDGSITVTITDTGG